MIDMTSTIVPKSDQLNSDDLISGPITITVSRVTANPDSAEQPVSIFYEGDNGKPYKACKSMRRVLVAAWGRDASQYVGRSMTLYRDPSVKFGGLEVGGIRISHMSHIDGPMTMALTATRASRKPFTVKPIEQVQVKPSLTFEQYEAQFAKALETDSTDKLGKWWNSSEEKDKRRSLNLTDDELASFKLRVTERLAELKAGET